jgi:dolichol-phosphate mannosyltransferase
MVHADCFVSVVAPLSNDADILDAFVRDVVAVLSGHFANYELVLVDDASTDDSCDILDELLARHEGLRVLRLSRPFGQEVAITAGLDSVIGDYTVVMLPEGDPPARIPDIVDLCRSGADVVHGVRRQRGSEPLWMRWGAKAFYWWCNRILGLGVQPNASHFRGLSRQAVNALTRIRDRGRHIRLLAVFVGYEARSLPYDLAPRRATPRRKSLGQALELAANVIMANSLRPLRAVGLLGLVLALVNAAYLVYVAAVYLFKKDVMPGWTTMSFQNAAMFMFVFLILAVLCEYVGRILSEGQGRPLYYVRDERTSSAPLLAAERKNVVSDSMDAT